MKYPHEPEFRLRKAIFIIIFLAACISSHLALGSSEIPYYLPIVICIAVAAFSFGFFWLGFLMAIKIIPNTNILKIFALIYFYVFAIGAVLSLIVMPSAVLEAELTSFAWFFYSISAMAIGSFAAFYFCYASINVSGA